MTDASGASACPAHEVGVAAHVLRAGSLGDSTVIDGPDAHHLARVRRLRLGEHLTVSDGLGVWRRYEIGSIGSDGIDVSARGPARHAPPPARRVTVAAALSKGTKVETIAQHLAELGVSRFVPFVAQRSVVRLDDAGRAKLDARLRATVRAAAMQSRRAWVCEVVPTMTFAELAGALDGDVLIATIDGDRTALAGCPGTVSLVTGPEGGFDPTEREVFATWGARDWCLSDGVLRAETAPLAAATLALN
jgi:16S rRNA (uracil1498-N3)-methyltransferase